MDPTPNNKCLIVLYSQTQMYLRLIITCSTLDLGNLCVIIFIAEKISLSFTPSLLYSQKVLSSDLNDFQFQQLIDESFSASKTRLRSVSAKQCQ